MIQSRATDLKSDPVESLFFKGGRVIHHATKNSRSAPARLQFTMIENRGRVQRSTLHSLLYNHHSPSNQRFSMFKLASGWSSGTMWPAAWILTKVKLAADLNSPILFLLELVEPIALLSVRLLMGTLL